MKKTIVALSCAALLSIACDNTPAPAPTPTTVAAPAPPTTATPAPPVAAPTAHAAVDVCALVTQAEVKEVLGGVDVDAGEPQPAAGSFLGGCNFMVLKAGKMVSVSARPATEWSATVATYKDLAPVAGVGQAAHHSGKIGMLVQPASTPYFLHLLVVPGNDQGTLSKLALKAL